MKQTVTVSSHLYFVLQLNLFMSATCLDHIAQ
jgi:hypothetical protein